MRRNDDGDIKLFVSSNDREEQRSENDSEIISVAKALDAQRSNGNLSKVEKIGKHLYKIVSFEDEKFKDILGAETSASLDDKTLYEIRVLMIFTAQVTLHSVLPQILSTQAVNSMYHYIRKLHSEVYDSLIECSSFSLYYLAIRNKVDVEGDISSTFAALCGKENDEETVLLGRKIFVEMGKYVKKLSEDIKL